MRILPSLSRGLRLALIFGLSTGYIAFDPRNADAKKHSDDDSGDDDDDSANDTGKNADEDTDTGDTEEEPDKDQPLVTAGGLFTLQSYPVRELARPLTITKKVTQLRIGLGTDISAKGAFQSLGADLDAIYGLSDNFELIGGLNSAYNFNQMSFYAGFEGSLVYDVVDIRVAANIHRSAIPAIHSVYKPDGTPDTSSPLVPGYGYFCDPPTTPGEMATGGDLSQGIPPTGCATGAGMPMMPAGTQTIDPLPTGDYISGGTQFSVDLGFPFRYSFTPEVAIVALQTLMSIDFNGVGQGVSCAVYPYPCKYDHMTITPKQVDVPDGMGGTTTVTANVAIPTGNSAKPDLKPSVGIATNPISALSLVIFAQLKIPDFDTAAGAFQVPVSLRAEFSPNQKFDIGLVFTLLNVKPPDPQSPLDNRFISTFMQARF